MDKKTISEVMRHLGSRTSEAKAAAVRENGKKGGRPRGGLPLPSCSCGRCSEAYSDDATAGYRTCPRAVVIRGRQGRAKKKEQTA